MTNPHNRLFSAPEPVTSDRRQPPTANEPAELTGARENLGAGDAGLVEPAGLGTGAKVDGMVSPVGGGRVRPGLLVDRSGRVTAPAMLPHESPSTGGPRLDHAGPSLSVTQKDWEQAEAKAAVCREFERLIAGGLSLNQAARALGKAPSWFSGAESAYARWQGGGTAALLPLQGANETRRKGEVSQMIGALPWFIPAARFFYLLTNRTRVSGSVPESVRRVISLPALPPGWTRGYVARFLKAVGADEVPTCPEDLRELILARERAGQALVPESVARVITARAVTVKQYRNKTDAGLDYLSAPGSMFFIHDSKTGERRPPYCGEVIEADDATINFPVCVPWTLGGDPCSDKYGVKVGRFQWLVSIDAARGFVSAYSYTMRPRGSYRGEDVLALVRAHCLQHGKPKRAHFEQGVWKSNMVKAALAGAGIELHTVWSPHQKPHIEGLFNTLWTKLSVHFPEAQVGRFRGENEEANDLLVACQRGARDPRRYFPMLKDTIAAFDLAVPEKNRTPVKSAIGSWVPAEAWAARTPGEQLDPQTEWLFAPWQREWTVRGMLVGGRVPLFEDLSVPFDFSAEWLAQYDGAKVRVHFDPAAPRCFGMLVLAEAFAGQPAGKVLGLAQQINEVAGYARLVMGWGDDPSNAGRLARQRAAAAMRREVRGIVPSGRGLAQSVERDGVAAAQSVERGSVGNVGSVERGSVERGAPAPATRRETRPISDEELEKRERAAGAAVDALEFL